MESREMVYYRLNFTNQLSYLAAFRSSLLLCVVLAGTSPTLGRASATRKRQIASRHSRSSTDVVIPQGNSRGNERTLREVAHHRTNGRAKHENVTGGQVEEHRQMPKLLEFNL